MSAGGLSAITLRHFPLKFCVNLLDRHIFKSVLFTCTAAVALFSFILMLGNTVKDLLGFLLSGQLSLPIFARLVWLLVPAVAIYALPLGMLTGVLLTLGRLSADSEITAMRAAEGAALASILSAQIDRIDDLVAQAKTAAIARQDEAAQALRDGVARLLAQTDSIDRARLAQELALLAVKTDITEEIDRLTAHLQAARALLAETGQIGRKFDFLVQEFLREANTLCSKAQSMTLTRIGLDLKTVIDQMREQVQNIE